MAQYFGFVKATDPTTPASDGSLIYAVSSGVNPKDMPKYDPDGEALGNIDGSTTFPGKADFIVQYNGVLISDAVAMYNEANAARDNTNALVWVSRWNKKTAGWETVLATVKKPQIGQIVGVAYTNLTLHFDGVGINTSPAGYRGGQQNPSASTGETLTGWYGRGTYGSGNYGQ